MIYDETGTYNKKKTIADATQPTGYGEAGSQYSKDMASQSSPSYTETKQINGVWYGLNSVTGKWDQLPDFYQNKLTPQQRGESPYADTPNGDVDFNTPGQDGVMIRNQETGIVEPARVVNGQPVIQDTSRQAPQTQQIEQDTSFTPFSINAQVGWKNVPAGYNGRQYGGQEPVIGESWVVSGETPAVWEPGNYDFEPAISKSGASLGGIGGYDPKRKVFVIARKDTKGKAGQRGQLHELIDTNINDFDATFSGGQSFEKLESMKKKTQTSNNIVDNLADNILGKKASAQSTSKESQGNGDFFSWIGNAINPQVKADQSKNWTMEDVNAGKISQHDYMKIKNKPAAIESLNWYLAKLTEGNDAASIAAQTFSVFPSFSAGGTLVGKSTLRELGVGIKTPLIKNVGDRSFTNYILRDDTATIGGSKTVMDTRPVIDMTRNVNLRGTVFHNGGLIRPKTPGEISINVNAITSSKGGRAAYVSYRRELKAYEGYRNLFDNVDQWAVDATKSTPREWSKPISNHIPGVSLTGNQRSMTVTKTPITETPRTFIPSNRGAVIVPSSKPFVPVQQSTPYTPIPQVKQVITTPEPFTPKTTPYMPIPQPKPFVSQPKPVITTSEPFTTQTKTYTPTSQLKPIIPTLNSRIMAGAIVPVLPFNMGPGGMPKRRGKTRKTRALWENPIEEFNPLKTKRNGVKKVKSNRKIKNRKGRR